MRYGELLERDDCTTATHKKWKKVTSLSIKLISAELGTGTRVVAKKVIKSKEKRLFIALGTTSHPVTLHHELDGFLGSRKNGRFRFFLYFNNFLATILGEEDA